MPSIPVNGEPIPVWIADYVLMGYGTGAIMAVPAHDQRDFEFARKYGLPIRLVYQVPGGPSTREEMTEALPEGGTVVNSGPFNGLPNNKETVSKFTAWLEETGKGEGRVNYRLRDWLISRQRYWGAPIPIIHCPACGEVPVPEDQLPVLLPEVENYQPPAPASRRWPPSRNSSTRPARAAAARRGARPTPWAAPPAPRGTSSASPIRTTTSEFAARDKIDYWLPVDLYVGGAEHAVMHLLYARFWTKVLYDAGLHRLRGAVHDAAQPGADAGLDSRAAVRRHEESGDGGRGADRRLDRPQAGRKGHFPGRADRLALGPDVQVEAQRHHPGRDRGEVRRGQPAGLRDVRRAVRGERSSGPKRASTAPSASSTASGAGRPTSCREYDPTWRDRLPGAEIGPAERKIRRKLHQTIRKVGEDIEEFHFNTAIAAMMELVNELYAYRPVSELRACHRQSDHPIRSAGEPGPPPRAVRPPRGRRALGASRQDGLDLPRHLAGLRRRRRR